MSHHIYHVPAFVMASIPSGEADAIVELFTEDLGRLSAHARGIRKESSRLRYVVQPMSWIVANVVRGVGGWRLTTATPSPEAVLDEERAQSLSRIAQIVRKFIPHESPVRRMYEYLYTHQQLLARDGDRRSDWEAFTLARMFHHLGYWGIETPSEGVEEISVEKKEAYVNEINRILRTVHT